MTLVCFFFFFLFLLQDPSFFHPVLSPASTTVSAVVQIASTLPTSLNIGTILARDSGAPAPPAVSTLPLMPVPIHLFLQLLLQRLSQLLLQLLYSSYYLNHHPCSLCYNTMLAPSPDALSCTPALAATTLTASLTPIRYCPRYHNF